jgi:hypothetical protein
VFRMPVAEIDRLSGSTDLSFRRERTPEEIIELGILLHVT